MVEFEVSKGMSKIYDWKLTVLTNSQTTIIYLTDKEREKLIEKLMS